MSGGDAKSVTILRQSLHNDAARTGEVTTRKRAIEPSAAPAPAKRPCSGSDPEHVPARRAGKDEAGGAKGAAREPRDPVFAATGGCRSRRPSAEPAASICLTSY